MTDNLSYGISNVISKIFKVSQKSSSTVIIGFLLGYPNSAKYMLKLYNDGNIKSKEATKLVSFTSNASMAYIICAIGISTFKSISIGIILLISHFLSAILIALLLPISKHKCIIQQTSIKENTFKKIYSSFDIVTLSITRSIKTLSMIYCYTVIFSLLPQIVLSKFNMPMFIKGFIMGIFEISNGINIIAKSNVSFYYIIPATSFILSFSSFMIIAQIYSFVYMAKVKLKDLIKYKIIQGLISTIITYILLKLLPTKVVSVFSNEYIHTFKALILPSTLYMYIILVTIILCSIFYRKKRQ